MGQVLNRMFVPPINGENHLYNENMQNISPPGQETALTTDEYFYLGVKKFKHVDGDANLLFGNHIDNLYLKHEISQLPCSLPTTPHPVKPLQVTVNIHKETITLIELDEGKYQVTFTLDTLETAYVSIFFLAQQKLQNGVLDFPWTSSSPNNSPDHLSQPVQVPKQKANILSIPHEGFEPLEIGDKEQWIFSEADITEDTHFPVVLLVENVVAHEKRKLPSSNRPISPPLGAQQQVTFCALSVAGDGKLCLQVLRQKLLVDGMAFILQDIYGLETRVREYDTGIDTNASVRRFSISPSTKPAPISASMTHTASDADKPLAHSNEIQETSATLPQSHQGGAPDSCLVATAGSTTIAMPGPPGSMGDLSISRECVICLSANRDTLVLPCRHLCVCRPCAQQLRRGYSTCPICRAPFCALLCLRGVRPKETTDMSHQSELLPSEELQSSTSLRQNYANALGSAVTSTGEPQGRKYKVSGTGGELLVRNAEEQVLLGSETPRTDNEMV